MCVELRAVPVVLEGSLPGAAQMVNKESPLPNNNKNNNMSYHSKFMFVLDKKIRNPDTFASLIYSVKKLAKSPFW